MKCQHGAACLSRKWYASQPPDIEKGAGCDVIERMCIEAALKLTGDNRASAARVLGLSRQALYLKMNRFGITDGESL